MYKFSVALFMLLISMATYVAAAQAGSFQKRADGYQQPVNSFRKRFIPHRTSRPMGAQGQLRAKHGGKMMHHTAPVKKVELSDNAKIVQRYCMDHIRECKNAIGDYLTLTQLCQGKLGGSKEKQLEQLTVRQSATAWCDTHRDDCDMAIS